MDDKCGKELVETLPFDYDGFKGVIDRFPEEKALETTTNPIKKDKIRLFYMILRCGLGLGSGFVVVKSGDCTPYLVTKLDFTMFEIGAVRWDLVVKDRKINVRHLVDNSMIEGIVGHLKTEYYN